MANAVQFSSVSASATALLCILAVYVLRHAVAPLPVQASPAAAAHASNDYGEASYWDKRYTDEVGLHKYEWYQSFDTLQPILAQHLGTGGRVLQVGVGTSELQAELITRAGFQGSIVNTDISAVAVQHMQQLHKDWSQLSYQVADARNMPEFPDASFDVVMDKGTLDAIRCGETADEDSTAMMYEMHRVLRPGGTMMMITYGPPFARLPWMLLPGMDWDVQVYVLGNIDGEPAIAHFAKLTATISGPIPAQHWAPTPNVQDWSKLHFVYVATKTTDAEIIAY